MRFFNIRRGCQVGETRNLGRRKKEERTLRLSKETEDCLNKTYFLFCFEKIPSGFSVI